MAWECAPNPGIPDANRLAFEKEVRDYIVAVVYLRSVYVSARAHARELLCDLICI